MIHSHVESSTLTVACRATLRLDCVGSTGSGFVVYYANGTVYSVARQVIGVNRTVVYMLPGGYVASCSVMII